MYTFEIKPGEPRKRKRRLALIAGIGALGLAPLASLKAVWQGVAPSKSVVAQDHRGGKGSDKRMKQTVPVSLQSSKDQSQAPLPANPSSPSPPPPVSSVADLLTAVAAIVTALATLITSLCRKAAGRPDRRLKRRTP